MSENSAGPAGEEGWDVQPTGATMKAVVLDGPGPPSALHIRQVPRPYPRRGWVLISVKAFGLNRSELHMRLGLARGVTFPRVPGSEAVGVVAACPGGEFSEGQQVATFGEDMGGPFRSHLDWTTLGAIPVMLATANGSLTIGLDAKESQSLLIRGGTSSVGMATAVLAKRLGMRVLSTTRHKGKALALTDIGVDEVSFLVLVPSVAAASARRSSSKSSRVLAIVRHPFR